MSLPNASIANLSVTRKTLDALIDKKPHTRAFRSRSRAYSLSLLAPALGTRRRCESFKGHENKKSRRLKGAGLGSKRVSCAAHGRRHESPDYFWMLA
jgi:hypothetical protein